MYQNPYLQHNIKVHSYLELCYVCIYQCGLCGLFVKNIIRMYIIFLASFE